MTQRNEYVLCREIAAYLRWQYPKVRFHFDYAGNSLTKTQAGQMKAIQHSNGFPDLMILHPVKGALFLELKAENQVVTKKDGSYKNEHHQQQAEWLQALVEAGFVAGFAIGFDQAKELIDNFLNN